MTIEPAFRSLKLGWTWCYLLKCLDGYLLIDTSYLNYFSSFRGCLKKTGIDVTEIKYVLLIHRHDDHAGFAAQLVKETGCRVVVHRSAMMPLRHGRSQEGKILYTPGHTHDSISALLPDGRAFVGDAAMDFLRFTGIKYKPVYCDDLEQVYESWKKLQKEGAQVIYPSHGKPFTADKLVPPGPGGRRQPFVSSEN